MLAMNMAATHFAGFLNFLEHHLTLQAGQMVDEQYALKMIHLVLKTCRHHSSHCLFMHFAFKILPARANLSRAFDLCILVRNRQAAFIIHAVLVGRV